MSNTTFEDAQLAYTSTSAVYVQVREDEPESPIAAAPIPSLGTD